MSKVCGRFTLTVDPVTLTGHFQARLCFEWPGPRYNIAPGQEIAVVIGGTDGREVILMRWGLVPPWTRDAKTARPLINVRAETVARKPAFRDSFYQRPCLVPADGYYEWRQGDEGRKTPFRIILPDRGLFALAGIWTHWTSPGGNAVCSCAVLTTPAADAVRAIHDRMPLILVGEEDYAAWLRSGREKLLRTYSGALTAYPVSSAVNSSRVDTPELIARA